MSLWIKLSAVVGLGLLAATPASAGLLFAFSDAEYAAVNAAASPFVQLGGATLQWGNPTSTSNWEYAIQGATDSTVLLSGNVPWKPFKSLASPGTNTLLPNGTLPLFNYASSGKLTMAFKTGTATTVNSYATIGKLANAFWIRGIMPTKGAYGSVALAGLTVRLSDGTVIDLDSLTADWDGEYVGFTDPRLSLGFKINWGFGYLNDNGGDAGGDLPGFQLRIGRYDIPPADYVWSTPIGYVETDPGLFSMADGSAMRIADEGELSPATVPEPASWALMIGGFAMIGTTLRRRRSAATA